MIRPEVIIDILKKEVQSAIGCTEPVAIALAAAHAYKLVPGQIRNVEIVVSLNVYKNAKAVSIPETTYKGIDMAAALGITVLDPTLKLNLFSSLNKSAIEKALCLVDSGIIKVKISYDLPSVYIRVSIETSKGKAESIIAGKHTNLVFLKKNQQIIIDQRSQESMSQDKSDHMLIEHSFNELVDSVLSLDPSSISFLLEGIDLNLAMAEAGLKMSEGLSIGAKCKKLMSQGLLGNDLLNTMSCYTAAACDARMAGLPFPVMTVAGSGNHGLVAIIPIALAAREFKSSQSQIVIALAIACLVTLYIKIYTGRLSPVCGCGMAAGAGCGAGIVHLLGGKKREMIRAIKNIVATLAGMICDGAKLGCALKLSACVTMAWQGALLAKEGLEVPVGNGMVADSLEETLVNLGRISHEGMAYVDQTIVSFLDTDRPILLASEII